MFIVEGPDGAGKTTLVKRLLAGYPEFEPMPRAVSKEARALTSVDDYIEDELGKKFGMRLYDRFALISSPCYAMLPHRTFSGRMWDLHWLEMQYHKLREINPVIVVCLPSLETVERNIYSDPDNVAVQKDIELIYINYLNFLATQVDNTSVMVWDYNNPNNGRLQNLVAWAKAQTDEEQIAIRREKKWKTDSK